MPAKKPAGLPEDANAALERLSQEFSARLEAETERIKIARGAPEFTAAFVETAYRRLTTAPGGRADAQKLVTLAFTENRFIEWTGYAMAVVLFSAGVGLLLYGVIGVSDVGSRVASFVGGSVAELVLVIPLRFSMNARRHNFGLRILAHLLDRVDDPPLLADCIRRLLGEVTPHGGAREGKA